MLNCPMHAELARYGSSLYTARPSRVSGKRGVTGMLSGCGPCATAIKPIGERRQCELLVLPCGVVPNDSIGCDFRDATRRDPCLPLQPRHHLDRTGVGVG